jgi:tripartite-type tricarboxylate transporter receptor subunit TctC
MIGLMSHEVDMVVIGVSAALPQIQTGKVRPLAVLAEKRVPSLPGVPTATEAGIENFVVNSWYGILTTGGTPRSVIDRLNAEWGKIAAMPDTREKLQKVDYEPMSTTPEQFSDFIKTEIARWTKIIQEANIRVE